jgi:hypothetical protein
MTILFPISQARGRNEQNPTVILNKATLGTHRLTAESLAKKDEWLRLLGGGVYTFGCRTSSNLVKSEIASRKTYGSLWSSGQDASTVSRRPWV